MASDGVGEVRHRVRPVVRVCRERGVGTPDIEGRCSIVSAGEDMYWLDEAAYAVAQKRRQGRMVWVLVAAVLLFWGTGALAVAERLARQALGSLWRFQGFLATPGNGKHPVLHIQDFQQD